MTQESKREMNKTGPRLRYRIHDRDRLASLIRELIDLNFEGNTSAAARHIGLNQPELYRLSKGGLGAVGNATMRALRRLVPMDRMTEFESCFLSPRALEHLAAYDEWLTAENERLLKRPSWGRTDMGRAIDALPSSDVLRMTECDILLRALRKKFPQHFKRFDTFLYKHQHFEQRAQLAFMRIVAPLVDAVESGLVERDWREMSDQDLLRFVKAGIARERVLLDRSPDVQRAQRAGTLDPVEVFPVSVRELYDPRAFFGRRSTPVAWRLGKKIVEGRRGRR